MPAFYKTMSKTMFYLSIISFCVNFFSFTRKMMPQVKSRWLFLLTPPAQTTSDHPPRVTRPWHSNPGRRNPGQITSKKKRTPAVCQIGPRENGSTFTSRVEPCSSRITEISRPTLPSASLRGRMFTKRDFFCTQELTAEMNITDASGSRTEGTTLWSFKLVRK